MLGITPYYFPLPNAIERMIGEQHPAFATLKSAFSVDDKLVFISEWVEGLLFSRINGKTIEQGKVCKYLERILLAFLALQENFGAVPSLKRHVDRQS